MGIPRETCNVVVYFLQKSFNWSLHCHEGVVRDESVWRFKYLSKEKIAPFEATEVWNLSIWITFSDSIFTVNLTI